eukprot:XP_001707190.1 Hypothetical protein GL50803_34580 [Giardia lamblia ATCC 50803]
MQNNHPARNEANLLVVLGEEKRGPDSEVKSIHGDRL